MPSDPNDNPPNAKPDSGTAPPRLPETLLSALGPAPSGNTEISTPPLLKPNRGDSARRLITILLRLCLWLFLADGVVSLVDDSLILLFDVHFLTLIRETLFLFFILIAVVVYILMGFTPIIPKRLFLPVTLFNPVAWLVAVPFLIYFHRRMPEVTWAISFCQVVLGISVLYRVNGGLKFHWRPIAESRLEGRRFCWRNLFVFLLVNVFVLFPAVVVYLVFFAGRAVDHFSDGFLALRPNGLNVQVRKYVRNDGEMIQLFPMSHIGEPEFYRKLSQSFPSNSIILMEGVSDNRNLLTNKITYHRMATSLGLAEQQKEFNPTRGEMVMADIDVDQFSTNTIDLLNLVMLIHVKGASAGNILKLMQYSPPPHFEEQLFDDLLRKRNRHLLNEIHSRLSQTENIIVPWGVAHMPEIASEIQKAGFRLTETDEYVAIRFGPARR